MGTIAARRIVRAVVGISVTAAMVVLSTTPARAAVVPVGDPSASAQGAVLEGLDLDRLGYELNEFFIDGTADSYHAASPLTNDDEWSIAADGAPQPFKTRLQVLTPTDPGSFDGTVYVEWFNVSAGRDAPPEWVYGHVEMQRQGAIYVGVSAQAVGVDDLTTNFPDRYGSLVHPGDSYSYDIFRQVGDAIADDADTILGGSFEPERLVAMGESQSAGRMTTYVNGFGDDDSYDGYLIHSRGASGAPLRQAPLDPVLPPSPTSITALDEPVLTFQAETDSRLGRQADSPNFRWWEVAGTAHIDAYAGELITVLDYGNLSAYRTYFDLMINAEPGSTSVGTCELPFNAGPMVYVFAAALRHLDDWVADGTPPPTAPLLTTTDGTGAGDLVLDEHGNATGGIRTPHLDAPIATLRGTGNTNAAPPPPPLPPTVNFCALFGTTEPFDAEKLSDLYRNHGLFVMKWARSAIDATRRGFILSEDAWPLIVSAAASDIGKNK